MKFSGRNKPWLYIFFLAAAIVVFYKLIDHFDLIISGIKSVIAALNPFIIGFVIAYLLNQPCNSIAGLFERSRSSFLKKHADAMGVLAVYLIIAVLFAVIMRLIIPALYKNLLELFNNLPLYAKESMRFINELQEKIGIQLINTESFSFEKAINYFIKEVDLSRFGKYAEGLISATSGLINVFIALIVSIYMCIDKKRLAKTMRRVTSIIFVKNRSENIFDYIGKINDIFSKYIYCKVIEAGIVTVLSTVVLSILRIKYALMLGILIGVMNMIPYFGSIISTVVSILITIFSCGIFPAIWTGVALLILEQIDGNFIGPKIIGDMLDMRPLWVIFSVTIGGGLFGIVGLLLSVPVMMVIKMIFADLLNARERRLNVVQNNTGEATGDE